MVAALADVIAPYSPVSGDLPTHPAATEHRNYNQHRDRGRDILCT